MKIRNVMFYMITIILFIFSGISQKNASAKLTDQERGEVIRQGDEALDRLKNEPQPEIYLKIIDEMKDADPDGEIEIDLSFVDSKIKISGWRKNQVWFKGKKTYYYNPSTNFYPYVILHRLNFEKKKNLIEFKFDGFPVINSYYTLFMENNITDYAIKASQANYSELEVFVPEKSTLSVSAFKAAVEIQDFIGEMKLNINHGSISTKDVTSKNVQIYTSTGQINFNGNARKLQAESISGKISITGNIDDVLAHTVESDISYKEGKAKKIYFLTVNGDLNLNCMLDKNADVSLNSINEDIALKIPAGISAKFSLNSSTKKAVYSDFLKKSGIDKEAVIEKKNSIKSVNFTTGSGEGNITVNGLGGRITLNAR